MIIWKTKSQFHFFRSKSFNLYMYIFSGRSFLNYRHVACCVGKAPFYFNTWWSWRASFHIFSLLSLSFVTFSKNGSSLVLSRVVLGFCSELQGLPPTPTPLSEALLVAKRWTVWWEASRLIEPLESMFSSSLFRPTFWWHLWKLI